MKKYNILVTGVGAIIGYGIINSLRASKYQCNIIGLDIYNDAVGQFLCDSFVQAVPAKDENYIPFIKKVFKEYKIDLMFFGTEQEITKVSNHRDEVSEIIDKMVLNTPYLIDITNDKWKTYCDMNKKCQYMIPSYIDGKYEILKDKLGDEFLMKPRRSYASKGIVTIKDEVDFDYWKHKVGDQFMVQPVIGDNDHEYTVGVFGFGNGNHSDCIILKRKLSGEGATAKATVVFDSNLEKIIHEFCSFLKPIGPTNFQFRKSGDNYFLLEINPRISSSTSIRCAFGFNEAEMCIDYFVEDKKKFNINLSSGTCVRYICDWIEK